MCLLLITITLPVFYPSFASLPAPQLEITMWLDIRNWLDLAQTGNGGGATEGAFSLRMPSPLLINNKSTFHHQPVSTSSRALTGSSITTARPILQRHLALS